MASGRVTADHILSGSFEIADFSKRNSNSRVVWRGGGLFLKQGTDDDRRKTLAHEAMVCRFVAEHPRLGPDRAVVPALVDYLPDCHLVVLDLVDTADTYRSRVLRTGRASRRVARAVAVFLAKLHDVTALTGPGPELAGAHDDRAPFGLTFDAPDRNILSQTSSGAIELVRIVQGSPLLREGFARLRALWRSRCLVHGDLRWDNCLVLEGRRTKPAAAIRIVDWELAVYGDPAWDVAAWLAEHLALWAQSVPITGAVRQSDIDRARFSPATLKPAITAFWDSYAGARRLSPSDRADLLDRTIRYSAARLVQSAFEWSNVSATPPPHAALVTQMAENILRDPDRARLHLFGLLEDTAVPA